MDAPVKSLATYDGPDRVVSSVVYAQMLKDRPVIPKHKTGIDALDEAIDGFEPGELVVVSGPTAMGKTTLCQTVIRNLNRAGKRSLFFSFEVTPAKMIQMHLEPDNCVYLPLQHKAMDLHWLLERTIEAIEKYQISAVFVDHLHYVIDMRMNRNVSLEIGATMRFLKRDIAIGQNLPVFIVCHIDKLKSDEEPSIHNLRDSSFVGQEADHVWIVFRRFDKDVFGKPQKSMLQGLATVKIDKARRTGAMGLKIRVKKDGHELVESKYEPDEK